MLTSSSLRSQPGSGDIFIKIRNMNVIRIFLGSIAFLGLCFANLVVLYFVLASPPIHFVYDVLPPAGNSTVYVPGSGFSGFWFHLGALQAIPDLHDYDYYCYSSGCLSVVLAAMNASVAHTASVAIGVQQAWLAGNVSRFEIVDYFLDELLGDGISDEDYSTMDRIEEFLPNLNVLVTSKEKGVEVVQPTGRQELIHALKQTTWIPYVTGEGVLRPPQSNSSCSAVFDDEEFYLDGAFSRVLHPTCEFDLWVPTSWIHLTNSLNPAMTRQQADLLWEAGQSFDHPLLASQ